MPDELGRALERIYKGQANVAKEAKELGLPTDEVKRIFRLYALERRGLESWEDEERVTWPWA